MGFRKLNNQKILLTGVQWYRTFDGGSVGSAGNHVLAVARRENRLAALQSELETASGSLSYLAVDVTSAGDRNLVSDWVVQNWDGELDVLINNAGIGSIGPFSESDESTLRNVMEVNFFAAVELIRDSLRHLRQSKSPVVCNIASVWGILQCHLKVSTVPVSLRCMDSPMLCELNLRAKESTLCWSVQAQLVVNFLESVLSGASQQDKGMSADIVGALAIRAIEKRKREVLLSWGGNAWCWQTEYFRGSK